MEESKLTELYHNARAYAERRLRARFGSLADEFPAYCVETVLRREMDVCGLHFLMADFLRAMFGRYPERKQFEHALSNPVDLDELILPVAPGTETMVDLWRIFDAIECLSSHERVFFARIMLNGDTAEEVAADFECTFQNVNQRKLKAIEKVRKHINAPKVRVKNSDKRGIV
jgi:hypothetical protein